MDSGEEENKKSLALAEGYMIMMIWRKSLITGMKKGLCMMPPDVAHDLMDAKRQPWSVFVINFVSFYNLKDMNKHFVIVK